VLQYYYTANVGRLIREPYLDDKTACQTVVIPRSSIDPADEKSRTAVGKVRVNHSEIHNVVTDGNCIKTIMGDKYLCECVP
jgi:hypothetical protein